MKLLSLPPNHPPSNPPMSQGRRGAEKTKGETPNPKISQDPDSHLAPGDSLYQEREVKKTASDGSVCFKLLVYPGKMGRYSSAWVPPGHDGVRHWREETWAKNSG